MRKTTMIIATGAVAAVLGGGAVAYAAGVPRVAPTAVTAAVAPIVPTAANAAATHAAQPAQTGASSDELDAAIAAAIAEVGAGTVVDADVDDNATHAYEIEIRLDAGGYAEVKLAHDLTVVSVEHDDHGDDHAAGDACDLDSSDSHGDDD